MYSKSLIFVTLDPVTNGYSILDVDKAASLKPRRYQGRNVYDVVHECLITGSDSSARNSKYVCQKNSPLLFAVKTCQLVVVVVVLFSLVCKC